MKRILRLLIVIILCFCQPISAQAEEETTTDKAIGHISIDESGLDLQFKGEVSMVDEETGKEIKKQAGEVTDTDAMNYILTKYKSGVTLLLSFATLTLLIIFIILCVKFGSCSGNPKERVKIQKALIVFAIAAAGMGAITVLFGITYKVFD